MADEFALLMVVDEHKAFQVMMTNDLAREGEEPDLTQITLEVTNNLPVVSHRGWRPLR